MNFQFYLKKLHASEEFKEFKKENASAFLCSAFFSIDKTGNDNKQHFDFFNKGEIISFQLEDNYKRVLLENFGDETPAEIFADYDFKFKKIEKLIQKRIDDEGIKNTLQKVLISIQNSKGKISLTGTAFISGMGIINFIIDLNNMEITYFEKKSIFDMMKIFKK
ncbi:MAG: hypothetical protein KKF67_03775 [Nanoarchaeota archaeon]|nr:hypothetical protein [Nanoarchaeota archaeon]